MTDSDTDWVRERAATMSSLFRRLVIFATVDGLIIQGHGTTEHHKSLLVEYESQRISERPKTSQTHNHSAPRLEAFGLIGFVDIASLSHLIAITKREEVARIFGKPVYLVTDVAILPLSSQSGANQAIKDALGASDSVSDESGYNSESEDTESHRISSGEQITTPAGDIQPYQGKNSSSTSVAEDVATRNVSFGNFATQWLSRQRWPAKAPVDGQNQDSSSEPRLGSKQDLVVEGAVSAQEHRSRTETGGLQPRSEASVPKSAATLGLLPRILRTTKMIFTSGSYFFSYDIDLTQRFEYLHSNDGAFNFNSLNTAVRATVSSYILMLT